jgi:hypothetical protein
LALGPPAAAIAPADAKTTPTPARTAKPMGRKTGVAKANLEGMGEV